jgi:PAS domain S-box-containing protein
MTMASRRNDASPVTAPTDGLDAALQPDSRADDERFVDLIGNPACIFDSRGFLRHLNPAWRSLCGLGDLTEAETTWTQLIYPEDSTIALARFQKLDRRYLRSDFECRLRGHDGGPRWFLLTLQPLGKDPQSDWLCTCADIHPLKMREADLQERGSIQTDLLNLSQDCIKLISITGDLIYMNRAGCQALGVPEDSSFGMNWVRLLPETSWEAGEEALAAARNGSISRFSGRSALPGEQLRLWDNALTPIKGPDGYTTAIFCVSRETTAEFIAQDALRQSQERLIVAARVGGMGIWDFDVSTGALYCDDTWHRIVGRDSENPVTSFEQWRKLIHPDDVESATEIPDAASAAVDPTDDYGRIFRIVRDDGEIRWVRSAAFLTRDIGGNVIRGVGFLLDITDMLRSEMDLRDSNRMLAQERDTLAQQCMEDPLTGIANRRYLDAELSNACLRANRTYATLAVGMIDVDYFKAFNDQQGHMERQGTAADRPSAQVCGPPIRFRGALRRRGVRLHPSRHARPLPHRRATARRCTRARHSAPGITHWPSDDQLRLRRAERWSAHARNLASGGGRSAL